LFSSSSSSSSSSAPSVNQINDDNENVASAAATGNTIFTSAALVPTTVAPTIDDIFDNLSDSLQRIVQTISTILQQQQQQPPLKEQSSDTSNEKRVQQIVQQILEICEDYNEMTNIERNVEIRKDKDDSNDFMMERLSNINGDTIKEQVLKLLYQLSVQLQKQSIQYQRYELLVQLMQMNYTTYVTTASFLCSVDHSSSSSNNNNFNQMQRYELPNVQDVPYITSTTSSTTTTVLSKNNNSSSDETSLVPDCTLEEMKYQDSILDQVLLYIFRSLVTKHTNGITSSIPGIRGLLEQGRTFMVQQKGQPPDAQHIMVQNTLGDLMTPILPPFYRIFMSGIIPKLQLPFNNMTIHAEEKQYGPWFYAPFLTSYITPIFFKFLVGPSYPNRHRETGSYGGLLVTKCKFLQESNCKGLCLHQCKIPAQNFFNTTLGLSLNVVPNFVTQECQWNFNEVPIMPVSDDPSFPVGCIRGCTSRMIMNNNDMTGIGPVGNICN
jgi:hypothetical protein